MNVFDRKSKGKPRGKPFAKGTDPRINTEGRPPDSKDLIKALNLKGEDELSILEAGLAALAKGFKAGNTTVIRLCWENGIFLPGNPADEEDIPFEKLPHEEAKAIVRLIDYWSFKAYGFPEEEKSKHLDAEKIQKAIDDSRILDRIRRISEYQPAPDIQGEFKDGEK